jgi:hypothetical protein
VAGLGLVAGEGVVLDPGNGRGGRGDRLRGHSLYWLVVIP